MTNNGLPTKECFYAYRICDAGLGYAIGTRFESASNVQLYLSDNIPSVPAPYNYAWNDDGIYEL